MIGMSREIYFVYLIALTNKHLKCLFLLLEGKIWFFTHILIIIIDLNEVKKILNLYKNYLLSKTLRLVLVFMTNLTTAYIEKLDTGWKLG